MRRTPFPAGWMLPVPDSFEIDVLNRFPDPANMHHTVRIMAYMFPRQFGLHNVFTSVVDPRETAQPLKDYTMREDEIRRLESKTPSARHDKIPKRLRGTLPQLISKMQKLHCRCSYKELLDHYCSTTVRDLAAYQRLLLILRQTQHSWTTKNVEAHDISASIGTASCLYGSETVPGGPTEGQPSQPPPFLPAATPPTAVSAFTRAVIARVVPNGFWGLGEVGEHNKQLLMRKVDQFIHFRKFESLSLHEILQGFKVCFSGVPSVAGSNRSSRTTGDQPALAPTALSKTPEQNIPAGASETAADILRVPLLDV